MINIKEKPDTEEQVRKILNPVVDKWFFSKFKEFSLPQLYGVREIHSRGNILISAPTGATKTLTAFLSILNELVDCSQKGILEDKIYCIYISPLKALSNDIFRNLVEPLKEIENIQGNDLGIRVAVRTGDTTQAEKSEMLKHPPHILITTPESLGILLSSIKFKEYFRNTDWCIVDEIHALAENKRGTHLSISLERLNLASPGITRVGLSATISPIEEIAKFLVGNNRDCKIVDVQFIKELDLKVLSPSKDMINKSYEETTRKTYELIDKLVQEHKTTLIFTNTRAGTERVVHHLKDKYPSKYTEIEEGPPQIVTSLIGAHHGSLSKDHRFRIENVLKEGKLKCVVCSTSLELGIDIGYIDLVILLGSPKSVARALQRCGRSGHQLHAKTKARIIVMDRDDLVECSVLLKNAVEKKIDKIHIPENCLDVLAQQVFGMCTEQEWEVEEVFKIVKQAYPYRNLTKKDFKDILDYLSGEFATLEDRHVYAKIWNKEGIIGRRGKMARVIYMTNIGTIPDQSGIIVKVGEHRIGMIDEGFLERLKRGDIFVLGGDTYRFKFGRGMTAQVEAVSGKKPTVPSWFSEMLPLSFDLALEIQRFRKLIKQRLKKCDEKEEIIKFILDYLYVDENAAEAIYRYLKEQYDFSEIADIDDILIETYDDGKKKYHVFHTLYGRRVNDALSRILGLIVGRGEHKDVEVGINDNGFYLSGKNINVVKALNYLKENVKETRKLAEMAIDNSEILRRRFRHCAGRALMILRNYKGRRKAAGRQQVSSMILLNAVRRISDDFSILREAKREVLEDLMDVKNCEFIISQLKEGKIKVKEGFTLIPSPFAFNIILQGYSDLLKMEDRVEFIRRMHDMVLTKIALKNGKSS